MSTQWCFGWAAGVLVSMGIAVAEPLDAGHPERASLEAEVEATSGAKVRLSPSWSKPAVLFYEDKDATALNQHVKDELFKLGRERGLLTSVNIVAVANVQAYNWFPARNFVLAAVKKSQTEFKVPVYCDFTGALTKPPFGFEATGATVALVLEGRLVWKATGALSAEQRAALLQRLEAALPAAPEVR